MSKPIDRQALIQVMSRFLALKREGEPNASIDPVVDEDLVALFVKRMGTQHQELIDAMQQEDWDTIFSLAHSIKGSSPLFGRSDIASTCEAVCESIREQDFQQVRILMQRCDKQMVTLK